MSSSTDEWIDKFVQGITDRLLESGPPDRRMEYDFLRPDRSLVCASCGKHGAVMGYGGEGIPACEQCITTLSSEEFQERIRRSVEER